MNHHGILDVATVRLSGALLGSKKFFAESLESPPIADAVADATTTDSIAPKSEEVQTVEVETPTGTYEAGYRAWRWRGEGASTIVFHHGSGENPFDLGRFSPNSVRRLFPEDEPTPANVIAVRAPFHDGSATAYARAMGNLRDFVGMLAASTGLVEALVSELHDGGSPAVVVSGISLGGWVSTLHRAVHGSAELYAPIFAGDRLGEMFVSSAYRHMTGNPARERPDTVREKLDFEEAYAEADSPTKPVLARYDRIIEYDVQRPAFDGTDLEVIDYGHVTGSLQSTRLREHVIEAVTEAPGYGG